MLIDKGVSPGEVVSFKLSSGEEIITKLVEESDRGYKISKPMVLSMGPKGIGMVPFMFTMTEDKDVLINRTAVMSVTNTDKQFADQYIQGTTGIKLV